MGSKLFLLIRFSKPTLPTNRVLFQYLLYGDSAVFSFYRRVIFFFLLYIYIYIYIYVVHSIGFQTFFFSQVFKIVVDS